MSWQTTRSNNRIRQIEREHSTRRFTAHLHSIYRDLVSSIQGIEDTHALHSYASLLLYRLMFMYFLQNLGLLANDRSYLPSHLREHQTKRGCFYRDVLLPLFTSGELSQGCLLPITNLFSSHEIEQTYPTISIPDTFFTATFTFFDEYQWQCSDHATDVGNVITPEILGTLFENHTQAKSMGTYYTPREITEYIARSALIPALFIRARAFCSTTISPETLLWQTLAREPLRYIYAAARKGHANSLPPEIASGLEDVTRRASWQQRAPAAYALPGETWREVIARRQHVDTILARTGQDIPVSLDQLITWNLNLPLLALETLRTCQQAEVLAACYQSLRLLTVLDPTCGSGAFLCAALPLLQDLYNACLVRMEELCAEHSEPSLASDYRRAFQAYLEEAGTPAQRTYTCLQWIISHNLYGVDLNEEAVEVCRLRLCLELSAARPAHLAKTVAENVGLHIHVGNSLLSPHVDNADPQITQARLKATRYQRILNWSLVFPAPMARGGFDVVIGNPPYVEYKHVRQFYTVDGYATLETGNLYALTMERAAHLLAPGGRFGMIVPSSATCTHGYRSLQKLLLAQQELHIASFSDQRGHLFALPHPRLCIILYSKATPIPKHQNRVFATSYIKLGTEARSSLFEHLNYTEVTPHSRSGLIPRYGSPLELAIYSKLALQPRVLGTYLQNRGANAIHFTRKLSWYVQVTPFIPLILDAQGKQRMPSELKNLYFSSPLHARIAFTALNSNLFYWLITTGSDCRNLNMREVRELPLDLANIPPALQQELCHLADELESDLLKHSRVKPMVFQSLGRLSIQCLYPAHSKPLIDEIDRVLAQHYAFDAQELDFLLHYDEKYRRAERF